jgi:hypothetical protein
MDEHDQNEGGGNSLLALIVVLLICIGSVSVVLKFADEIDGQTYREVTK